MDDQGRCGGVSDQFQDLWEVGVSLPGGLRERSAGLPLGTADRGRSHRRARDRGDRCVAPAALYGPGDRRVARPAALDGLGDPDPDRDGPARPVGPGAGRALRARAPGRVDPYRRQEARTHPGRRRQTGLRRLTRTTAAATPTPPDGCGARPAGTTCTSPSTIAPGWPTPRSWATRRPAPRSHFWAARSSSTHARHHRRARADRQRLRPTSRRSTRSPAAPSGSATCAPGPDDRRPTARPSASSAPCCR